MNSKEAQLEAIREMRNMMERSSRFLSLSGLAGILVGVYAILGIAAVYFILNIPILDYPYQVYLIDSNGQLIQEMFYPFLLICLSVLFISVITGTIFALRNARKKQIPIWDATSKRLLWNMLLPLLSGAIFCILLLLKGQIELIAPTTLVFYGLSLFTASKYTIDDVRYLGMLQVALGLIALYFTNYGLFIWAIGFGVLHILYGFSIYFKYEK